MSRIESLHPMHRNQACNLPIPCLFEPRLFSQLIRLRHLRIADLNYLPFASASKDMGVQAVLGRLASLHCSGYVSLDDAPALLTMSSLTRLQADDGMDGQIWGSLPASLTWLGVRGRVKYGDTSFHCFSLIPRLAALRSLDVPETCCDLQDFQHLTQLTSLEHVRVSRLPASGGREGRIARGARSGALSLPLPLQVLSLSVLSSSSTASSSQSPPFDGSSPSAAMIQGAAGRRSDCGMHLPRLRSLTGSLRDIDDLFGGPIFQMIQSAVLLEELDLSDSLLGRPASGGGCTDGWLSSRVLRTICIQDCSLSQTVFDRMFGTATSLPALSALDVARNDGGLSNYECLSCTSYPALTSFSFSLQRRLEEVRRRTEGECHGEAARDDRPGVILPVIPYLLHLRIHGPLGDADPAMALWTRCQEVKAKDAGVLRKVTSLSMLYPLLQSFCAPRSSFADTLELVAGSATLTSLDLSAVTLDDDTALVRFFRLDRTGDVVSPHSCGIHQHTQKRTAPHRRRSFLNYFGSGFWVVFFWHEALPKAMIAPLHCRLCLDLFLR